MSRKTVFKGTIGRTLQETRYKYEVNDNIPKNHPNVIYIVMDDMGFAQLGCYGSTINTPNIDRLARGKGCAITISIPRRSAPPRGLPCLPARTIIPRAAPA